jgi:hypothetical protein
MPTRKQPDLARDKEAVQEQAVNMNPVKKGREREREQDGGV